MFKSILVISLSLYSFITLSAPSSERMIEDEVSRELAAAKLTQNELQEMITNVITKPDVVEPWSFTAGYYGNGHAQTGDLDYDQTLKSTEGYEIGVRYRFHHNFFMGIGMTRNQIKYQESLRSSTTGQLQSFSNNNNLGLKVLTGGDYRFTEVLGLEGTLNIVFNNSALEAQNDPITPYDFGSVNFRQTQASLRIGPAFYFSKITISPYLQIKQSFIRIRKKLGTAVIEKENLSYGNNSFGATISIQI